MKKLLKIIRDFKEKYKNDRFREKVIDDILKKLKKEAVK